MDIYLHYYYSVQVNTENLFYLSHKIKSKKIYGGDTDFYKRFAQQQLLIISYPYGNSYCDGFTNDHCTAVTVDFSLRVLLFPLFYYTIRYCKGIGRVSCENNNRIVVDFIITSNSALYYYTTAILQVSLYFSDIVADLLIYQNLHFVIEIN